MNYGKINLAIKIIKMFEYRISKDMNVSLMNDLEALKKSMSDVELEELKNLTRQDKKP